MNTDVSIIDDNDMTDITNIGVQVHGCGGDIDINDNDFSGNIGIGAIWCNNNRTAAIETSGNEIDFTSNAANTGIGISVTEYLAGENYHFKAQSNTITAALRGIWAFNLNGEIDLGAITGTVYIGDNSYISQNKSINDVSAGILIENCRRTVVTNNYVTSESGVPTWIETGIRHELGSVNVQTCNTVDHIGRGIFVSGNVFPNGMAENTFNDNESALFLNYGIIGQQGIDGAPHDNKWLTGTAWDDSDYFATVVYDDDADQTYVTSGEDSPFHVRTGGIPNQFNPPAISHVFFGMGSPLPIPIFTQVSGSFPEPCLNFNPEFFEVGTPWINEAKAIAHNINLGSSEIDINLKWMAKYGLYKYMVDDALLMGETPLSNFYDSCFIGNIGIIDRSLYPLQLYTVAYDESMGAQVLPAPGTDDAYLDSLLELTPSCNTEQNLIDFLTILYTNVADDTEADNADIEAIRDIAELCPYTGGFGVYMARAWLLEYDTLMNNYVNVCEYSPDPGSFKWDGNNTPNTQQQPIVESNLTFKLYPNPNNGQMILDYDLGELLDADLVFSNIYGQSVFSYRLKQGSNKIEIDLNGIAAGMYLAKITFNEKTLYKEKIIIFK